MTMRNTMLVLVVLFLNSCSSTTLPEHSTDIKTSKVSGEEEEEKWEVIVFDPGYETFLVSRARPMNMFSDSYLKSRNQMLVSEWNSRYLSGRNRDIYEVQIDYDSTEDYGLEFNYRLYQFFAYVSSRYGVKFDSLSLMDARR